MNTFLLVAKKQILLVPREIGKRHRFVGLFQYNFCVVCIGKSRTGSTVLRDLECQVNIYGSSKAQRRDETPLCLRCPSCEAKTVCNQ